MQQKRESLGSRLGFILLSAGCAIGIGNVWRFPWLAGQYGGGWFVLFYLLFLVVLGVPVMAMEFAAGRAAQRSPVRMYHRLERPGAKWHWHGAVCFAGNALLMMYYTTVAGWMLSYAARCAVGAFEGLGTEEIGAAFGTFLGNLPAQVVPMVLVTAAGFGVCALGLRGGLERVTKWMMLALMGLMVVLAGHSLLLRETAERVAADGTRAAVGAWDGLRYFLVPDRACVVAHGGWLRVAAEAMNQAFFTLSLGMGAMAIFGSYIGRDHALLGEAVRVALLDTLVALCAGAIILPACFAFGVEPGAGPGLLFVTLPNIFNGMAAGRVWGTLFFVFMAFAAFSTVLAVFECLVACVRDLTGWSRQRVALAGIPVMVVLSLPCALGWSALGGWRPFGEAWGILDMEDFVVSNVLLPLGSLVFVAFCSWRWGWGWERFAAEANAGKGMKVQRWMRGYCAVVLPAAILALFGMGLWEKFGP